MSRGVVLDLCAGSGAATAPLAAAGFEVVRVDLAPGADVQADVREWSWTGPRPVAVWASPPCTEFSREGMPWCRTGVAPDLSIVRACLRVIRDARPLVWTLENVRFAPRWLAPLLGPPREVISGRWVLWGSHRPLRVSIPRTAYSKERRSSSAERARSAIPEPIALAWAVEVERWCAALPGLGL